MKQAVQFLFVAALLTTASATRAAETKAQNAVRLARIETWIGKVEVSAKGGSTDCIGEEAVKTNGAPSVLEDLKAVSEYLKDAEETAIQRHERDMKDYGIRRNEAGFRDEISLLATALIPYVIDTNSRMAPLIRELGTIKHYAEQVARSNDVEEKRVIRMAIEKENQLVAQIAYQNFMVMYFRNSFLTARVKKIDEWEETIFTTGL